MPDYTMREQLAAAYPNHMARIEELTSKGLLYGPSDPGGAGEALCGAFVWESTDEGHAFWHDLARQQGYRW